MTRILALCALLMLAAAQTDNLHAQESNPLTVGLADCPPFVMLGAGEPTGMAVYLWEEVARELGLEWNYTEFKLGELLELIEGNGQSSLPDVSISCTSITSEREEVIDFSHSFHETYTAIAVKEYSLWSVVVGFITHPRILKALAIVLGLAALIGLTFYLLENKQNKKLFSNSTPLGRFLEPMFIGLMFISNGPIRFYRFKTLSARFLATMLTMSSTFMIAAITAILASSFTLDAMKTEVRTIEDLRNVEVATMKASTSSALLAKHGITHRLEPDLISMINDLNAGNVDAVVSDAAFLKYEINLGKRQGDFKDVTVLPNKLAAQNYAFVLRENSPLREDINRTLLSVRIQEVWSDKIKHYIGE